MNETSTPTTATTAGNQQISNDGVQKAIRNAEDMFHQAATVGGEKAAELRERAMEQLRVVREKLHDAQDTVVMKSKAAARATDDYVHDHPWKSIATAAAIGVVVGLLLNRR
ncbi:DUF883 family protein [Piscinibacter sakaiensis]|uniref:DUF883 family protein n=1 Tax=Piscinibacter sakaiensis TaxID=1547922 RepID=UPI003AACA866